MDSGDGESALDACLGGPTSVTVDASGNVIVGELQGLRVRIIWAANGTIDSLAGIPRLDANSTLALNAVLAQPSDIANAPFGTIDNPSILIADTKHSLVRLFNPSTGFLTTFAGTGMSEPGPPEGGPATEISLGITTALATDAASRSVYVAETVAVDDGGAVWGRVRIVFANGTMSTAAGSGAPGWCGDGLPARDACLGDVSGMAFAPATGNLYIATYDDTTGIARVAVLLAANGTVVTFAGGNPLGCDGSGGPAIAACIDSSTVAVDTDLVYVNDLQGRVCVVDPTGTLTTFAGSLSSTEDFCGDDGPATSACLNRPAGLAVDASRNLYIADLRNQRIRRVSFVSGIITTVAGSSNAAFCGDGGDPLRACLLEPIAVLFDLFGNMHILDGGNARLREIVLSTSVGCAEGYSCECGTPVPCTSSGAYCPPNTLIPAATASGYFTFPPAMQLSLPSSDALHTSQRLCPVGFYCVDGARTPCAAGSYGTLPKQFAQSACTSCTMGSYGAVPGLSNATSCLSCPVGSIATASGNAFCHWCPPNAFANESFSCIHCYGDLFALPGSDSCNEYPVASSTISGNTSTLQVCSSIVSVRQCYVQLRCFSSV
jgi:hypothetical protein